MAFGQAEATASAHPANQQTTIDEETVFAHPEKDHSAAHAISNTTSTVPPYAFAQASTLAVQVPDSLANVKTVVLQARAQAGVSRKPDEPFDDSTAGATAYWSDRLRWDMVEPDVNDFLANHAVSTMVRLSPQYDGEVTVDSGLVHVNFKVELSGHGSQSFDKFYTSATGQIVKGNVDFGLIPAPEMNSGQSLTLKMTLLAEVIAYAPIGTASADFSHTAFLPAIEISDANGNYIPGSEVLKIVGDSGIEYPVVAVPEPSGPWPLSFALVLLWRRMRNG